MDDVAWMGFGSDTETILFFIVVIATLGSAAWLKKMFNQMGDQ